MNCQSYSKNFVSTTLSGRTSIEFEKENENLSVIFNEQQHKNDIDRYRNFCSFEFLKDHKLNNQDIADIIYCTISAISKSFNLRFSSKISKEFYIEQCILNNENLIFQYVKQNDEEVNCDLEFYIRYKDFTNLEHIKEFLVEICNDISISLEVDLFLTYKTKSDTKDLYNRFMMLYEI